MKKIFFPFLLIANLSFAQVDLNLGLRAYYPFTGNANDISGNNNNPVSNNATLTADRFGNPNSAYHFDGATTYMQVPNSASLNTTNKLSLSAWVKPMGFYSGPCHGNSVITKGTSTTTPGLYMIWYDDNAGTNGANCSGPLNPAVQNFYGANGMVPSPGYTPYIQTNQWYHVVVTYDGTTVKLYVNCQLKYSGPQGGINFTNTADLFIGKVNNPSFPYWVNGDIDEVRIYDRALNVDEVNVLGGCIVPVSCNSWLNTPTPNSNARIGDLDISGNQLTVEASFNRTGPVNPVGGYGFLVSKHTNASNLNYAMWPEGCSISTNNGQFFAQENCTFQLNKTYHVAMVYDGVTLKYYQNGFLHSQTPATGNLILNDLITTIGQNVPEGAPTIYPFIGYMNEVRIWNVARTQAQLQTYMNNSLPNPTTQTGLMGYYTFDNLLNKQGNAAFNATLNGASAINATNTNCTFVPDSCAASCNNWLRTQTVGQSVTIGDLDISGNQMTIEGNFNCSAYPVGTGNIWEEIVSKHNGTNDCNYALRMNLGAITTTNGFFRTPAFLASCDSISLNKTYHAAMVYNGSTLKFYRNGFLMSQIAATGNLVLNNLLTTIGDYAINNPQGTNFQGYLNEIRIWNIARTQSQLQTYMNSPLPNPTTQTGLLAYFTFDNLLNKQGNPTWNGTLNGGATINNTNPNCSFVADSCLVVPGISGIINDYTPVLALDLCANKLTVEDATRFNTGDTVLMIQMKGAIIDSTNTAAFGTITDYRNSGNYEFNYVKAKVGNIIELRNAVTRQYDIPTGKVQLIRVPYYNTVNISSTLTCLAWDGTKGGVLAFNVLNTITLNADMDVNGKGFKGGIDPFSTPGSFNCNENQYYYPPTPDLASGKGEGIAVISSARSFGKGALANGGGGGVSHNSGGGGGGNTSTGGFGGYQLEGPPCNIPVPFDNRGLGGKALTYSNALNKIFMGGGGGAGHTNNPQAFESKGGDGGGIIIVSAGSLASNTKKIIANGNNAPVCGLTTSGCHEGMGGGGAAGSILLQVNNYSDNANIEVRGGKGGDMTAAGYTKVGPGGGGSGGVAWLSNPVLPGNVSVSNNGGLNGVCPAYANDPWGATPGTAGQNLFNLVLPVSLTAFQKNIDSVRIKDSLLICNSYDFKGLAYINTSPITTWQWYFGDGGTANTQNTTHTYTTGGTFNVKLVVSDVNGCKDSISKAVNVILFTADAGADTTVCSGIPATVMLRASAGATYAWTPAAPLNNPSIQNPVAIISANTRFYVTITNAAGCTATDSVLVSLASAPSNMRYTTRDAFPYQNLQLQARNIGGTGFQWLPNIGLNDNSISNPVFYYNQSQEYTVRINTASGCVVVDTQLVVIKGKKGIYVPRGFTPNGDGNNDRLYPILIGIKQLNYFKIYNRWGNLLFETTSGRPEDGWDGTFKGLKQPVETYTWVVEGIDIDNIVITKNGNTLLIR